MTRNSSNQILKTKLYKPVIKDHYLTRNHIIKKLERYRENVLTLVVAPSGYGKSVAVSQWLNSTKSEHCWISIDEEFNDIRTFLLYLTYSVRKISSEYFNELNNLISAQNLPPQKVILNTLINEIDEIDQELIIVLDDYHLINNEEIHNTINKLLKYPPRNFHLVIISRTDPSINLSKQKSFQNITQIRTAELCFSKEETKILAQKIQGKDIHEQNINLIVSKTEGWIVGIRLVIHYLDIKNKLENPLEEIKGDKYYLTEYLLNEIFNQIPKHSRELLLVSSAFARFNKELIIGLDKTIKKGNQKLKNEGELFFEQFKNSSQFIVPLDEKEEWFRFHHLFSDFLLQQLKNKTTESEIKAIHKIGSEYFYRNGLFEEAIKHAVKSDNISIIRNIFRENKYKLLNREKFNTLLKWLELVPNEVIIEELDLLLTRALLFDLTAEYISMKIDLETAEKLLKSLKQKNKDTANLKGEFHSISSGLFYYSGKLEQSLNHSQQAIKLLTYKNHYYWEFTIAMNAIVKNSLGDFKAAEKMLERISQELPPEYIHGRIRIDLAKIILYAYQGNLKKILQLSKENLDVCKEKKLWVTYSNLNYYLSRVNYEWNNLDNIIKYTDSIEEYKYAGRPHWIQNCYYTKVFTLQQLGMKDELDLTLSKLYDFANEHEIEDLIMMAKTCEIELAIRQKNIKKALSLSKGVNFNVYPPVFYYFFPQLTEIKLLYFSNDQALKEDAKEKLANLITFGENSGTQNLLLQALPMLAIILFEDGNEKEAVKIIQKGLFLAKPGGFIRAFIDYGKQIEKILMLVQATEKNNKYVKKILNQFKKKNPPKLLHIFSIMKMPMR